MPSEKRTDVVLPGAAQPSSADKYYKSGDVSAIPGSPIDPNRYVRVRKRYSRSNGRTTTTARNMPTLQLARVVDLQPVLNQVMLRLDEGAEHVKIDVATLALNDMLGSALEELSKTHKTIANRIEDVRTHVKGVDPVVAEAIDKEAKENAPSIAKIKDDLLPAKPLATLEGMPSPETNPTAPIESVDTRDEEAAAEAEAEAWVKNYEQLDGEAQENALATLEATSFVKLAWVQKVLDR